MEKQLVSFGNYLLERYKVMEHSTDGKNTPLFQRQVHDADLANWKSQIGNNTDELPSRFQIGDYVVASFPPHNLLNCKVEGIRFKENAIHYDLSIRMKKPNWDKAIFTKINDVHWSFVCAQGEEDSNNRMDLSPIHEK